MYPPGDPRGEGLPKPNVQWCKDCGRYFNPDQPHECRDIEVASNRRSLEQWLGRFKIREEG